MQGRLGALRAAWPGEDKAQTTHVIESPPAGLGVTGPTASPTSWSLLSSGENVPNGKGAKK